MQEIHILQFPIEQALISKFKKNMTGNGNYTSKHAQKEITDNFIF